MKKETTPIIASGDTVNGQSVVIAEAVKTFDQIKEDVVARCKEKGACQPEFKRILAAENMQDLLQVLKDNMAWCLNKDIRMIDGSWLEANFGTELLWANHIYTGSRVYNVSVSEANAQILTLDSSSATVKTLGSSSATVKTLGSSSATVKTLGSSSATVETWGSSSATVKTLGSSSATVETLGSSSATVETLGSSSATVKTLGSSSATVAQYQSSKLTHSLGDGPCPLIKHLTEKKVYIKTSDFEIVQVN